jgi:two-component system, OmpR family, KDP operon response regulator KdpE
MKHTILIIEDEKPVRKFLSAGLSTSDYKIIEAEKGHEGIVLAAQYLPDVILVDLGLPDIDGIELIREIREWYKASIIVISARWKENEKVAALDSGADDYLTKPFGINELQARIRVAIRNNSRTGDDKKERPVFEKEFLKVDFESRSVFINSEKIHLTPIEYKLLSVMIKYAGKVVTHKQLLEEVWGGEKGEDFNQYARVYMAHLRRKIEPDPAHPKILITEVGVGYRLTTD